MALIVRQGLISVDLLVQCIYTLTVSNLFIDCANSHILQICRSDDLHAWLHDHRSLNDLIIELLDRDLIQLLNDLLLYRYGCNILIFRGSLLWFW